MGSTAVTWSLRKSQSGTKLSIHSETQVARAYKNGSQQSALCDVGAQSRELPNLSYTHALILLGVPEEDRGQFISDIDIESMTTREPEQAVNELKQSKQETAGLQKALAEEKDKNTQLAQERDNLKKETSDLRKSKQGLQLDVEKKVMENKELPDDKTLLILYPQGFAYKKL